MSQFEPAIRIVLKNEGGYADNPDDPGGETKYGISKKAFPDLDIKNLTEKQARDIYYENYWKGRGVEGIEDQSVANFVLDTVVQHGGGPGIIQRAVNDAGGNVTVDNAIGPKTREEINKLDPALLLGYAREERLAYIDRLIESGTLPAVWRSALHRRVNGFFLPGIYTLGSIGIIIIGGYLMYRWMQKRLR